MLQSPISFKNIKTFLPFTGEEFFDTTTRKYQVLGSDLGLYNLVTVILDVKAPVSEVGGLYVRTTGRSASTESTTAVEIKGVLNKREMDETHLISSPGQYIIYYDISVLTEGWFWIRPSKASATTKVSDVVNVRIAVQNSNNLVDTSKNVVNVIYRQEGSAALGSGVSSKISVPDGRVIKFKATITGEATGTYEFYIRGQNALGEVRGIPLYNLDGSFYEEQKWSTNINGWFCRLPVGDYEFLARLEDFDTFRFDWRPIDDHSTPLLWSIAVYDYPFPLPEPKQDNTQESNLAYNSKSFVLEKTLVIEDCYWDTFVRRVSSTVIGISVNGIDGDYTDVEFNDTNFPNLVPNSTIYRIQVLPYSRSGSNVSHGREERIIVITNKGQIYHNYPERPDGAITGDVYRFDESVIWDLPIGQTSRRHPSNNPSESRDGYAYDPTLLDYSYELSPPIGEDNGYGNGGFGASIGTGALTRPRFYQFAEPVHDGSDSNKQNVDVPFRHLGVVAKTRKMSFIGAYQVTRARVCLFGTNDGGRNWFVMYEFASGQIGQSVGWGQTINTSTLPAYVSGSFSAVKRSFVSPTTEDKEPANKFSYGTPVEVSSITNNAEAVVTTSTPHGLADKDIVIFVKTGGSVSPYDFMANTQEVNSGGTGKMYQVEVLSSTTFKLHEYIYSPDNNLTARHIHYTQALKDFIAFGTGETHPDGWLMLMELKQKDAYAANNPVVTWYPSFRLNSSKDGVQRTCGFWMRDDDPSDPTIYLPMDEVGVTRPKLAIPDRTSLPSRSSAGIFRGKLSDIDDFSKLVSVFDVEDVNIWSVDYNGVIVAGFQMGYVGVSLDGGDTWEVINRGPMPRAAGVDRMNNIYFSDGTRLVLK